MSKQSSEQSIFAVWPLLLAILSATPFLVIVAGPEYRTLVLIVVGALMVGLIADQLRRTFLTGPDLRQDAQNVAGKRDSGNAGTTSTTANGMAACDTCGWLFDQAVETQGCPKCRLQKDKAIPLQASSVIFVPGISPQPSPSSADDKPAKVEAPDSGAPEYERKRSSLVQRYQSTFHVALRPNQRVRQSLRDTALQHLKTDIGLFNAWRRGRNFVPLWLADVDFSGRDLRHVDWRNCVLTDVNFAKANLSGGRFAGAVLHRTVMTGAKVENTDLATQDLSTVVGVPMDLLGAGTDDPTSNRWMRPMLALRIGIQGKTRWTKKKELSIGIVVSGDFTLPVPVIVTIYDGKQTQQFTEFVLAPDELKKVRVHVRNLKPGEAYQLEVKPKDPTYRCRSGKCTVHAP